MCQWPHLLEIRGFKAVWFDKRKSVEALHLETVYGLIINLPSDFKLLGLLPTPFTSKHWIAIKALDGHFFNLDSKLENPIKIGKVAIFLKNLILLYGRKFLPTVVSYQNESFSSKWELPSLLSPSFITRGRMEARRAALILIKNSHFDRTPQYDNSDCNQKN